MLPPFVIMAASAPCSDLAYAKVIHVEPLSSPASTTQASYMGAAPAEGTVAVTQQRAGPNLSLIIMTIPTRLAHTYASVDSHAVGTRSSTSGILARPAAPNGLQSTTGESICPPVRKPPGADRQ